MRTYDFSPLYRSTIGFDRLFDMLGQSARAEATPNWPPYNVERTGEDDYRITMAFAGFHPDEIELVQKENTLFVAGHKNADQHQGGEVLHRGIATRPFRQTFSLAEHVKVGLPLWSGGFCKEPEHPRRAEWHRDDRGDGSPASTKPKRFSA